MLSWMGRLRSGFDILRPSPSETTPARRLTEAELADRTASIDKLKSEIKTLWHDIEDLEAQMDVLRNEDARKMYRPFGKQYDIRMLSKKLEPLQTRQTEMIRAVTHYQEILAEEEAWLAQYTGEHD